MKKITLFFFIVLSFIQVVPAQQSVAREWNEELLHAIRNDFARPTVHARNLFHSSVLMYDAWAIFDSQAETVFLGKNFGGFPVAYDGIATPADVDAARHEIISYAMFRLLNHRFASSPGSATTLPALSALFSSYGYDDTFVSTDYSGNSYAALGNYMADRMIAFGLQDGAREATGYDNEFYNPVNPALLLDTYLETNDLIDPNRWQPLNFVSFIDQSGNPAPIPNFTPEFLSPEWGAVTPYCLKQEDLQILNNGFDSYVYNDPGPPEYIQNSNEDGIDDPYKWHFALVISWSAHLDPANNTMIDISPAAIGNVDPVDFPETFAEYQSFYDFTNGGDAGTGHAMNPITMAPYTSQMVKRADYGRVLAEFWADGPDSETPPGHWFTIMNYVSDHPMVEKRFNGQGPILSDLEWDVKCYLTLGGGMHDSAVNTWGIKGYYDYLRPISAIRYMAGKGQSSDLGQPSYDPHGLPLIPGLIELVESGDPLAGDSDENVGRIKVMSWKGPDFIADPETDIAGVDWILGTHWWPYQRATFVTPPFAGYLSGHSTFSRAAAEILTLLTGDAFFPGGMGTFDITQNDFLFFEQGPSTNMTLQWATYRDAADQTSLSRIWGGIHPPIDDIRGRLIGEKIGIDSFNLSLEYFTGTLNILEANDELPIRLHPVPFKDEMTITHAINAELKVQFMSVDGKIITDEISLSNGQSINTESMASGIYFVRITDQNNNIIATKKVIKR